jgi:hypothetical protein
MIWVMPGCRQSGRHRLASGQFRLDLSQPANDLLGRVRALHDPASHSGPAGCFSQHSGWTRLWGRVSVVENPRGTRDRDVCCWSGLGAIAVPERPAEIVVDDSPVKRETPLSYAYNGGRKKRVMGLEPTTFTLAT